jgi:hypothetical protein
VCIAGNGPIAVFTAPTGDAQRFEKLDAAEAPLLKAELATIAICVSKSRLRLDGKASRVRLGDGADDSNYNQTKTLHDRRSNYARPNLLTQY